MTTTNQPHKTGFSKKLLVIQNQASPPSRLKHPGCPREDREGSGSTHHGEEAKWVVAPWGSAGHGLIAEVLEFLLCLMQHLHALRILVFQFPQLWSQGEMEGVPEHPQTQMAERFQPAEELELCKTGVHRTQTFFLLQTQKSFCKPIRDQTALKEIFRAGYYHFISNHTTA